MFRRLAVLHGGCSFGAAAAVGNVDDGLDDALETILGTLVDQHLLLRYDAVDSEPRVGMLETIREFALERLAASGETEPIRRAHAEYFARLAEAAEPMVNSGRRRARLRQLDAEQANVRAALEYALES